MNNTEKKLDALIDALGFDVEKIGGRDGNKSTPVDYKLTKRGIKTTKGLRSYLHECFNGNDEPQHYCDDCGQIRTLKPDDVSIRGVNE